MDPLARIWSQYKKYDILFHALWQTLGDKDRKTESNLLYARLFIYSKNIFFSRQTFICITNRAYDVLIVRLYTYVHWKQFPLIFITLH